MESRSGNVNRAPSKVVIKAPGKAFRAGISLIELFETFPDNATAEAWFTEQRWPDGKPICPHCGHDDVQVGAAHASQRYRCRHRECGRRFSVKIGTVMEGSNIKLQKWAIAIYLIATWTSSAGATTSAATTPSTTWAAWRMAWSASGSATAT